MISDWATNTAIDIIADIHCLPFEGAVIMIAARLRTLSNPPAGDAPADGEVPGAVPVIAPHPRRGNLIHGEPYAHPGP
jgi:hypothetical protein